MAKGPNYEEMREYREKGRDYKESLVQRLIPRPKTSGMLNPFAFGGGLVQGGLTKAAMDALPFRFDYMGASEYEWGAVPECLYTMAENSADLVASTILIPVENIRGWMSYELEKELRAAKDDDAKKSICIEWAGEMATDGKVTVHIIAHRDFVNDVEADILEMVTTDDNRDRRPRDSLSFPYAVFQAKAEHKNDVCGWLALHRAFFFATSKDMFDKTWNMFQATAEAKKQAEKADV